MERRNLNHFYLSVGTEFSEVYAETLADSVRCLFGKADVISERSNCRSQLHKCGVAGASSQIISIQIGTKDVQHRLSYAMGITLANTAPLATSGVAGVTETTTTTVTSGTGPAPGLGYGAYGVLPGNSYSQTTYNTGYPGGYGASTLGVSGLGVSTVPVSRTSTVSMGTTTVAPTIYEKAVIQEIPGSFLDNVA